MKSVLAIVLVFILVPSVNSELSCDRAVSFFNGILSRSLLNELPMDGRTNDICGGQSESTCCSAEATAHLRRRASNELQSIVESRVEMVENECRQNAFEDAVMKFVESEKVVLENFVITHLSALYSKELMGLFDDMVDQVGEYILNQRPLCGLQNLVMSTVTQMLIKAVNFRFSNVPNDPAFQLCYVNVFNSIYSNSFQRENRRALETPIMTLAHIFHFKQLLLNYTRAIDSMKLSAQCVDALAKFRYCDGCSGNYTESTMLMQCSSDCHTVMEVCLYPFQVIEVASKSWIDSKDQLNENIGTYPPLHMFTLIRHSMFQSVLDAVTSGSFPLQLVSACGVTLQERPLDTNLPPLAIQPTELDLTQVAMAELECLTNLTASVYFPSMVDKVCKDINATAGCDHMHPIERLEPALLIPEQGILADALILQSRFILKIAFACDDSTTCPNIDDYCWINNLNLTATPTMEPPEEIHNGPTSSVSSFESLPESRSVPTSETSTTLFSLPYSASIWSSPTVSAPSPPPPTATMTTKMATASATKVTKSTTLIDSGSSPTQLPPQPTVNVAAQFPTTDNIDLKPKYWTDVVSDEQTTKHPPTSGSNPIHVSCFFLTLPTVIIAAIVLL